MSKPNEIKSSEVKSKHGIESALSKMSSRDRHALTAQFAKDAALLEQGKGGSAGGNIDARDKATNHPQDTQNRANDNVSPSQPTESGDKLTLQRLAEVAYNWIENFKQSKLNPAPKEVTLFNRAVKIYNKTLKHLDSTDLRRVMPVELRLRGGADNAEIPEQRIQREVLESPEWRSQGVQDALTTMRRHPLGSQDRINAAGRVLVAYQAQIEISSGESVYMERSNAAMAILRREVGSREVGSNPNPSEERQFFMPRDIFEEADGW